MKKFDLRREQMQREFEEKLKALDEQEQKELERTVRPLATKLARVVEDEAKKLLEAEPERMDGHSFRKKEAAEAARELLKSYFPLPTNRAG
jgi:erythromycin esterase-like protein